MMTAHETARSIARSMTAEEIRGRCERIRSNLANPAPACRGASRAAARRDAARALSIYAAALIMQRAR